MKKQISRVNMLGLVVLNLVGCVPIKPDPIIVEFSLPPTPMPSASALPQLTAQSQSEIDIRLTLPTPSPGTKSSPEHTPSPALSPSPAPKLVESVKISQPVSLELQSGQMLSLSAQVLLSDLSTNQALTWASDAPQIASISSQGILKSFQAGTVTVRASSQQDPSISASLALTIRDPVVHFQGQIVFARQDDFFLMKGSNLNPIKLTQNGALMVKKRPRFAWDGSEIVFSSSQNAIFRLKTSPGSTPQEITGVTPNLREPFPYLGQDGTLYFQAIGAPYFEKDGNPRIWRKTANNPAEAFSNRIELVSFMGGVTPQGLMVYEEDAKVKLLDVPQASDPVVIGPGGDVRLPLHPNPEVFVYGHDHDLYLSNFKGESTRLTQTPASDYQAALSPDQSQIVFVSDRSGNQELYLMNRDGSGVTQLTFTPGISETGPDWGP